MAEPRLAWLAHAGALCGHAWENPSGRRYSTIVGRPSLQSFIGPRVGWPHRAAGRASATRPPSDGCVDANVMLWRLAPVAVKKNRKRDMRDMPHHGAQCRAVPYHASHDSLCVFLQPRNQSRKKNTNVGGCFCASELQPHCKAFRSAMNVEHCFFHGRSPARASWTVADAQAER